MNLMEPCFEIGSTCATTAVLRWAEKNEIDLLRYLRRHHCGDWGDLDAEDKSANDAALEHGGRIFSRYLIAEQKIYVITEHDRTLTTVLFAHEY